ncbi:MAG: hypothetical protein LC634_00820, partial [Sphingomonadales bacterium]|nr:hypothetical protein [Sphingomonadales bacterium]
MAVIDRARGYIFFHVPKTAGVSIAAALVEQGGRRIVDEPDLAGPILERKTVHTGRSNKGLVTHARPWLLREILGPETYQTLESMAVVRCPWRRLRSVYHYQRQRPSGRVGPLMSDLINLPLSDFAIALCGREYSPIARLLSDREGTLLVDTLLRFETLKA